MTLPERPVIAVVEDDPIMGGSLLQRLTLEGYDALWWETAGDALSGLGRKAPDLLVCDIRLPDMTGEEMFRKAVSDLGPTPVLFITAYGDIDQAVRLMRAGAGDYLTKPFDMGDFLERIETLLQVHGGEAEEESALGSSAPMRRIAAMLRRIAEIDSSVLFTGESGVGKEVAARYLHQISPQADQPFMAVNCAAIPPELIDSEIFGHEKGAFTGAHARHEGFAERAGEGVLFLDEVGELPAGVQAKLLRLIQERAFFRVGGEQLVPFRARLLCATNAPIEAMVHDGRFRQDLYYRINVIPVAIPPLRERRDDLKPLFDRYVLYFADTFGRSVRGLTSLAEEAALIHDWPGNVRELRNRVERAVALAEGPLIGPADLFPEWDAAEAPEVDLATLAEVRDAAERRQIERALAHTGGQIKAAADLLGVSRTTLWEKMRRLEMGAGAH